MLEAIYYKAFSLALLFSANLTFAQQAPNYCDATLENPCLVQDSKSADATIRLFRNISLIADTYEGDVTGINQLYMSASEQPSLRGFRELSDYIRTIKQAKGKEVLILDLRQESHGYLNGSAITLSNWFNWINLDKSDEDSFIAETNWLEKLKNQEVVPNVLSPQQFKQKDFSNGRSVVVQSLATEEELAKQYGFKYKRLFVSDHRRPLDFEVDEFLKFVKQLPKNAWIHVHCRGGRGRTTTFLVMYDMMKNADKVSFDEIIARHASIPPFYNLSDVIRTDPMLRPYYEQRYTFLKYFYEYARQSLQGETVTWSKWREMNEGNAPI